MVIEKNLEKRPDEFDICFIDCDLIKYRASFAVEKTLHELYDENEVLIDKFNSDKSVRNYLLGMEDMFDINPSNYTKKRVKIIGEEQDALKACDKILERIKGKVKAKRYKLYITGSDTYRPSIATLHKYKGNRDGMEKPKWIDSVIDHLVTFHKASIVDFIETDDAMTVGMTACRKRGLEAVVANIDKDIKQVEGWHYDWNKDEWEFVTEWDGLVWTYVQAISGDPTDNYKGIPKVGKVKAKKILEDCKTEHDLYVNSINAYKNYFGEVYEYDSWDGKRMTKTYEELFLENMRLAFMLREKDKFYEPPTS